MASTGAAGEAVAFSLPDLVSAALIGAGLVFFLGASVGIARFPDFYTRMHAAGKGDTLSTLLITVGMAVHVMARFDIQHWTVALVALKIVAIGVFIMLTSPTSTHALMKAGFDDGIEPVTKPDHMLIRNLGGPFLGGATEDRAGGSPPLEAPPEENSAPGPVAKKRSRKKAAAKRTSAKKAPAKRAPTKKRAAPKKKSAAKKTAAKKKGTAAKKSARKKTAKKAPRKQKD